MIARPFRLRSESAGWEARLARSVRVVTASVRGAGFQPAAPPRMAKRHRPADPNRNNRQPKAHPGSLAPAIPSAQIRAQSPLQTEMAKGMKIIRGTVSYLFPLSNEHERFRRKRSASVRRR